MMTSSLKSNFETTNSWASRAGVVVGYKPEDTMKSFLFNQNNRHCINLNQNEMSILQLPQSEIEKALDFLSSDSESESSSMTKITVKNASSLIGHLHEKQENIKVNEVCSKSRSEAEVEMWNENDNSDDDCTSADIDSNDLEYKENNVTIGGNKTFEEILEEKLKHDTNALKFQKEQSRSDSGVKPKFTFLKKNSGKSAWCSNIKTNENILVKSNDLKTRSQSTERENFVKSQEFNKSHHPARKMKSLSSAIKKQEPLNKNDVKESFNKTGKPVKPQQKTVHFAALSKCELERDFQIENPLTITQVNQKVAEIEDSSSMYTEESQTIDKDLIEFELLEQIANVSISSSIASSIAKYDEDNLREKLWKFQNMAPPINFPQNKFWNSQKCNSFPEKVKPTSNNDRQFHILSICEEKTENITTTNTSITNVESDVEGVQDNSQDTSVNTTTLSEYEEPKIFNPSQIPFSKPKIQTLTRKISKQKERYKSSDDDTEEWIDESPFQLENNNSDKIKGLSHKILPKSPHVDWTFADPFHETDSSSDDENDLNCNIQQSLNENADVHQVYPNVIVDKKQSNPEDNINMQSVKLKQWVQLLESEVKRFKSENEEIEKLKIEKEEGLKRLEEEMKLFQKYKDEEVKKFEEYKQNEIKKLKKERKVFEDYQEAMKNMPNKKDRQEIDILKSEIDKLKEELSNKETRWQAASSRLKQKADQLESENSELHSRIHALEQKRLQLQAQLVTNTNQKFKSETVSNKLKPTVTSVSQAISMKHTNIPISSVTKEDNNNNKCAAFNNKPGSQLKKTSNLKTTTNQIKPQKQIKNVVNPFTTENGVNDIRGSAASDYYTGEEESGSVDSKTNNQSSNPNTCRNDFDTNIPIKQSGLLSLRIDRSNELIKDEIKHPDGILERIYMNGGIDVVYPNGSLKQISSDSKYIIVHLFNGDIKQITPDGRVIYFYAQDGSTQTTYSNGKEEILYKNGHKEMLHPSGIREITFPDKSIKILHPDLTEETFLPNGLVIRINSAGDKEINLPNGQKEIHTNGVKKRIYPDGTTKTVYPDGRQETFYASGRMRVKDKNGNLILDQYVSKQSSLTNFD